MSAQMQDSLHEFHANIERRNELIEQYRKTTESDTEQRAIICAQLVGCFERRCDWQRRHQRSYSWAVANGVIPKINTKGYRNGKPATYISRSALTCIARARDELHDHAMLARLNYSREQFAGEVLRQKVAAGYSVERALAAAKEALQTGMAA